MNPRGFLLSMMATVCAGLEGLPKEEYGINHDVFLERLYLLWTYPDKMKQKIHTETTTSQTITALRGLLGELPLLD